MQRILVLINKLKDQAENNAPAEDMMLTVQLLQRELEMKEKQEDSNYKYATVTIPVQMPKTTVVASIEPPVQVPPPAVEHTPFLPKPAENNITIDDEKVLYELKLDETELEPEIREKPVVQTVVPPKMPEIIAQKPTIAVPLTGVELNDAIPVNTVPTLNDKLAKAEVEVVTKIAQPKIDDLHKALSINEKFQYINSLFMGDDVMFDRSIKTINNFTVQQEAEFWIRRELTLKLGWNEEDAIVQQFYALVKRRF
jgi:hypothetical protein